MGILAAIIASIIVSIISLVGVFTLLLKKNVLDRCLFLLISFAAGGLIGGAFLHLIPEAVEHAGNKNVFIFVIAGFILFFVLEKYLHWRHCHDGVCDTHAFTYLNIAGDGIHNFIDGLIIGASFAIGRDTGVISTLIIVLHEIPQEIGDFGILIYGGFSRLRALFWNFLSALTAVAGTVVGFYFSKESHNLSALLLPIAAGGFIYIAGCDLIPEIHKHNTLKKSGISLLAFLGGILLILAMKTLAH